jgi:hypothetical protein
MAKDIQYSHDSEFTALQRPTKVKLGNWIFNNPTKILVIGGETLLSLENLEDGSIALSGKFYDRNSRLILEIDRNEWQSLVGNWDVEKKGDRLIIREAAYKLSLTVTVKSKHLIVFDDIRMRYGDVFIISSEGKCIEIYYKERLLLQHKPKNEDNGGIETNGYLDISKNGQLQPISGGTVIRAGTLTLGDPNGVPRVASTDSRRTKVARNSDCPCGSGMKYKKCHGR